MVVVLTYPHIFSLAPHQRQFQETNGTLVKKIKIKMKAIASVFVLTAVVGMVSLFQRPTSGHISANGDVCELLDSRCPSVH